MTTFSRRRFIATGVAAASAAWLGAPRMLAAADPVQASIERYAGFKVGIQSYSLRHFSIEQTIEHIADLGLHWVEFFPGQFSITHDTDAIEAVKAQLEPHHISVSHFGVVGFGGDEAENRRIFQFAKLAGIPVLSANPAPDSFPILHDLVQEFDIKICIHNHGPNARYDRVSDSLEAVERWDERIGFGPDLGHYMRSGEDPIEAVRLSKDRLYGMHLKEHDGIHRDGPAETILGEGALDLEALCETMREVGFNGPISVEYEQNPENPLDDIRTGLANFASAAHATA